MGVNAIMITNQELCWRLTSLQRWVISHLPPHCCPILIGRLHTLSGSINTDLSIISQGFFASSLMCTWAGLLKESVNKDLLTL